MSDAWDNTDVRDATPEEETMISTVLAQRDRIEELEAELAGAINVAYGVSEAAGKRRGELEAKLAIAVGVLEYIKNTLSLYSAKEALAKIKGEQY